MSAQGRTVDSVRARCLLTGESFQSTTHRIRFCGESPIVPVTQHRPQQVLEARLFELLARIGVVGSSALGIVKVTYEGYGSDRIPIVHLDPALTWPAEPHVDLPELRVAEELVPSGSGDDDACDAGVRGLTVLSCGRRDLRLGLRGTDAQVVLRAAREVRWRQALAQREADISSYGAYCARWDLEWEGYEADELMWLGSVLLRRSAAFTSCTPAYLGNTWTVWRTKWVVDLEMCQTGSYDHDVLLAVLLDDSSTDLVVDSYHCRCVRPSNYASPVSGERTEGVFCRVDLRSTSREGAAVQIRFSQGKTGEQARIRDFMQASGVPGKRVTKLLGPWTSPNHADRRALLRHR